MTENTLYSQNNNGFIRPIVKSQLLMELKTENFAINESVINLSENYLITEYSKKLGVVIMAGGKGIRMQPYTKIFPKPLLPMGEDTVIDSIVSKFLSYKIGS